MLALTRTMKIGNAKSLKRIAILLTILLELSHLKSVTAFCDYKFNDRNKVYDYSLTSPIPNFPHGVLSEDGFYKVAANGSVLWFQLCDGMIFNHDPPICVDCSDCGGSSRCGMGCSALVADNIGGYHVCSTIGRISNLSTEINVLDKKNPQKGVMVKMSSSTPKHNCSLTVSVMCEPNKVEGPNSLVKSGTCDYATVLGHPSGCAKIVSAEKKGLGWFGTVMIIILCLFGGYLLIGGIYRYYHLGVRGIDVIPNLDFWATLPHRIQSTFASLVRRFRGPSQGYRSSYSPVNF